MHYIHEIKQDKMLSLNLFADSLMTCTHIHIYTYILSEIDLLLHTAALTIACTRIDFQCIILSFDITDIIIMHLTNT